LALNTHSDSGHNHSDAGRSHTSSEAYAGAALGSGAGSTVALDRTSVAYANIKTNYANIQATGGGQPFPVMPPAVVLQYIIKY
jgi:microcystin-dependent protein